MTKRWVCTDGNEAAATIAYKLSEVIAIYPITPASPMGEFADAWAAADRPNLWGLVPEVFEMQSEAGAAGAVHGAVQKGTLSTTFTASQGLLLMLPNMFKLAGELTPAVIHVAARTLATHALSIFGDHSDVMSARTTGFAMLASSSVQEAHDMALIAHASTIRARVPFLHFFDGFRTSHEVNKIEMISDEDIAALIDMDAVRAHRAWGLSPDRPELRGTAQNPDVFFQAREAGNPWYLALPGIVREKMDLLAEQTGRRYNLVDYVGDPDAERVVVLMGSGVGAAEEAVAALRARGERVGVLKVRLFRPFPARELIDALPPSVRSIAVLDRTKEPGAIGEPLYQDIITALAEGQAAGTLPFSFPRVIGGRYGLSSKEFTPAMVKAVLDELAKPEPKNHFTVGIFDDVTHTSLEFDPSFSTEDDATVRAVFYGLGADGTVSANKSSVKIIGEDAGLFAQGYFVYDSKKSGSVTVSHLRFGPKPIESTYLIDRASFVACHQFGFLDRMDMLKLAMPGAVFLLNSPYGPGEVWEQIPVETQQDIIDKGLDLYVIDAYKVAHEAGMGGRINTVMQACFFALSGVLPKDEAIAEIKKSIVKSYGKRGQAVIDQNFAAVDASLAGLHRVAVPAEVVGTRRRRRAVPVEAPDFVQRVTSRMLIGEGDLLPVSALPPDGTFPVGTAKWEKRGIAQEIPIWDESICIDCGKCALVCPHAAIRMKIFDPADAAGAPAGFLMKDFANKQVPGKKLTIQVAPEDCTGCTVCVSVCPAKSKEDPSHLSINMEPIHDHLDRERENWEFFLTIPEVDSTLVAPGTIKGSQIRQPLIEFSGACSGCGETPYLKLMTQLFGDRVIVANATGCSSIYGGNLPTTPWTTNPEGRGVAWANSLFEDNAEFGLGMRVALDRQNAFARQLLRELEPAIGSDLVREILEASQESDADMAAQRARVARVKELLAGVNGDSAAKARDLAGLADELVRKSVWIVGGDGWAYDIGYGGLDHVLSTGRNVKVLVLDTEVYSNTGGQASKATPRAASAKFAAQGKATAKKDLGVMAMVYGNVYVAQIAMGADDMQTVRAFTEAEAWPGPALIIAYSTCIAHGFEMEDSMTHQKDAVATGYWPLYRYNPARAKPFKLDSKPPTQKVRDFALGETRFAMVSRDDPARFDDLIGQAQTDIEDRWAFYEHLANMERVPRGEVPEA
ncbi:MAG: pyruvate:ferredoxin (flavodoxin) oxidoreductase [Actinomycetota bacterium]